MKKNVIMCVGHLVRIAAVHFAALLYEHMSEGELFSDISYEESDWFESLEWSDMLPDEFAEKMLAIKADEIAVLDSDGYIYISATNGGFIPTSEFAEENIFALMKNDL